jgi:hypothetical protein
MEKEEGEKRRERVEGEGREGGERKEREGGERKEWREKGGRG